MGHPRPLFRLFSSFQTNITILTTIICEKILWQSSIRRQYSNPWPCKHESPPITTRRGLLHLITYIVDWGCFKCVSIEVVIEPSFHNLVILVHHLQKDAFNNLFLQISTKLRTWLIWCKFRAREISRRREKRKIQDCQTRKIAIVLKIFPNLRSEKAKRKMH